MADGEARDGHQEDGDQPGQEREDGNVKTGPSGPNSRRLRSMAVGTNRPAAQLSTPPPNPLRSGAWQRLMQTAGDIFPGRTHVMGLDGQERDFYVRQLWDWKGIARPETMRPGLLSLFGRLCGASLARAHARSGDPLALAAYLGGSDRFDRALTEFAQSYADQNERGVAALEAARRSGRIRAERR